MKTHLRLAGLAIVTLLGAAPAPAAELALRWTDGRSGPALALLRLEDDSDELFVSADALAAALDLERFWKPETRKLVLKAGEKRLQVTIDTRLVLAGDDDVLLRVPVRYRHGSTMLPLEFVERVLAPALGARLDRRGLVLLLGPGGADVLGIDYQPTAAGTEVRVRFARPLRCRVQSTSREIVRVLLSGAKIDAVALTADQPAPLVRSVRAEQGARDAALYLQVDPDLASVADRTEDGGRTLVLELRRGESRPVAAAPPRPARPLPLRAATEPDSFDLVVLDPGHGGVDRGVEGGGLVEKDLVLQWAQQIQPLLERDLGVRVLLLRHGDETIPTDGRAEIANRAGADALVSLHCNGWYDAGARGFEVLYAAPRRTVAGRAAVEAARSELTEFAPWSTAQRPFVEQSRRLAELLQVELERSLGLENRGARPADVEVVEGAAMAAVLVEVGFLTDPDEAATLAGPDFATRLAAALAAALEQFRARLGEDTAPPLPPAGTEGPQGSVPAPGAGRRD